MDFFSVYIISTVLSLADYCVLAVGILFGSCFWKEDVAIRVQ